MKQISGILILILLFTLTNAQEKKVESRILSESEVENIFTQKVRDNLGISYTIFRAYYYYDKSNQYYLVLTEREYKQENGNRFNDSIKGFNIKIDNGILKNDWSLRDFITEENEAHTEEFSIWFWTKYIDLQDLCSDGLIDPILVYGTSGINGTDDGRLKILIYYKGQKLAIRHQNGTLDFERNTQIDKEFYELPKQIQDYIRKLMEMMTENNHAIFPYGYKEKMNLKKIYINER